MGTPNLSPLRPVAIFSCVRASTSGLTRTAMGTVAPVAAATSDSARSSGSDSTLIWRMPPSMATRISACVLPTPEKTIRSPGTPAARARAYSPAETTSIPAPRSPSTFSTATLESDLTAKHTRCGNGDSASANSR